MSAQESAPKKFDAFCETLTAEEIQEFGLWLGEQVGRKMLEKSDVWVARENPTENAVDKPRA